MRDAFKVFAVGMLLTGYALVAPTIVEAVPADEPLQKSLTQRLSQVEGDAPVSVSTVTTGSREIVVARSLVQSVVHSGEFR